MPLQTKKEISNDRTNEPAGAAQIWTTYHILAQIADQEAAGAPDAPRAAALRAEARSQRRLALDARRAFPGTRTQLRRFAPVVLTTVFASTAVGHGFGDHFGHFGGMHGDGGPLDPAEAQEHAEHMVGHLAWAIDATAEQKQKLLTIARAMASDLMPLHEKIHAARDRVMGLLRQPKTDRAALEALRAEQIALIDDVSKRLSQGLADAADVLTAEQRTKLAQEWSF